MCLNNAICSHNERWTGIIPGTWEGVETSVREDDSEPCCGTPVVLVEISREEPREFSLIILKGFLELVFCGLDEAAFRARLCLFLVWRDASKEFSSRPGTFVARAVPISVPPAPRTMIRRIVCPIQLQEGYRFREQCRG